MSALAKSELPLLAGGHQGKEEVGILIQIQAVVTRCYKATHAATAVHVIAERLRVAYGYIYAVKCRRFQYA